MSPNGSTIWSRQTINSEIFTCKPDKWFKIWFYLVNRVNYKDTSKWKRSECFIKSGEIEAQTGATSDQVKKCLKWLRAEHSISTRRSTRGMHIVVIKYNVYQTLDTKRSTREAPEKHQRSTTIGEVSKKVNKEVGNTKKTLPLGGCENVYLLDGEMEKLVTAYGKEAVTQIIEELSCYIETTGKEYKSHYLTAQNWLRRKKKSTVSKEVHQVFTLFNNPAAALWPNRGHEVVAAQVLLDTYGLETLERRVARVIKEAKNGDQFFPNAVTPSQLLDKMPAIERYLGK